MSEARASGVAVAMGFEIWKELLAGKIYLGSWELCDVLLTNDSLYPGWLVLVPRRDNARELFDLRVEDQMTLIQEITAASTVIQSIFNPDKLNVGALGNVVAQLHIHVVPRFKDDAAWPGPVWGACPSRAFENFELQETTTKIMAAMETYSK